MNAISLLSCSQRYYSEPGEASGSIYPFRIQQARLLKVLLELMPNAAFMCFRRPICVIWHQIAFLGALEL